MPCLGQFPPSSRGEVLQLPSPAVYTERHTCTSSKTVVIKWPPSLRGQTSHAQEVQPWGCSGPL